MTESDIKHFLVVYDIPAGRVSVRAFGTDYEKAIEAYADAEDAARGRDDLDIVLLSADSLATIKRTHSSYFDVDGSTFESLLPPGVLSR